MCEALSQPLPWPQCFTGINATTLQRMSHLGATGSVNQWLKEVRLTTETECVCVLQGKSLSAQSSDIHLPPSRSLKDYADIIKRRAAVISSDFTKLFRQVENARWKQVHDGGIQLTCQIRSLLHECDTALHKPSARFIKQQQIVMEESARLAQYVDSFTDAKTPDGAKLTTLHLLSELGQSFSVLVDITLSIIVWNLLVSVDERQPVHQVMGCLTQLLTLALQGENMCLLITRKGAVAYLFGVCRRDTMLYAHTQALRLIATLCCVSESVIELDKVGGVACLSGLLGRQWLSEQVRSEAAGVLAQLTSPCLRHHQLLSGLMELTDDLTRSLTCLCIEASRPEVFLVACAVLANLTYLDSVTCDYLLMYHTAQSLIEHCLLDTCHSIYAKDQVVTVLANMAAIECCCSEIIDNHGIELLVQFLHEAPLEGTRKCELATVERVQQKAAIALTRLCRDTEVAQSVVDLNTVGRFVELCRQPALRSHSDAVLVACLGALRKISTLCGLQGELGSSDVQQLVHAPLKDAFLNCSGIDESPV